MKTVPSLKNRKSWASKAGSLCKLTPAERTVLEYLAYRSGGDEGLVYGRTLGALMVDINIQQQRSLAKRTIRAALKTLEGYSLITVKRHGSEASEYVPCFDFTPPRVAKSATPKRVQSGRPTGKNSHSEWQRSDTYNKHNGKLTNTEQGGAQPQSESPPTDDAPHLPSPAPEPEGFTVPAGGLKDFPSFRILPDTDDPVRLPFPGGCTQFYMGKLKEAAERAGTTPELLMFRYLTRGLDQDARKFAKQSRQKRVRANRPRRPTIRDQVIAVLAGGELPLDDIRKRLPDVPVASLQVTMARIFKRGEIIRPSRATYGLSSQERN